MLRRASLIAAVIVILDQLTKWWIAASYPFGYEQEYIKGLFRLVHTRNRGVAFGLLNSSGRVVQIGLLAVVTLVVCFIIWQLAKGGSNGLPGFGLSLVLGGAIGNLIDRIFRGEVIDFLDFFIITKSGEHHWPAFNVADMGISIGASLVILAEILISVRSKQNVADTH